MNKLVGAILTMGLAFACGGGSGGGGGSGVDGNKTVAGLSAGERTDVCEYVVDVQGDERTIDCGNGVTVTVGVADADVAMAVGECVNEIANPPAGCESITVAQFEACFEAVGAASDAEVCSENVPAACAPLFSCGQ